MFYGCFMGKGHGKIEGIYRKRSAEILRIIECLFPSLLSNE